MPPDEGEPTRRRFFSSARARILASYLILLLFSTAVGTIVLREVLLARAGERVDDALVQEIEEFRNLAGGRNPITAQPFGTDARAIFDVFLTRNVPGEAEAFFTFVDGDDYKENYAPGLEPRRHREIDELAATTDTRRGEFEAEDETRFRYVVVPVEDVQTGETHGVFAVVIDLSAELDEVNEALQIAVGVNVGVLILASMLAWVIAGRVLQPLRLLRDTARSISESDLTRRIPVEGDDELADLARTFNEMVDRLEEAFASQKSFISDAGHELRTPIKIIRGQLDVMGDDPEERRETLDLVRDELDRMSRLVNDLLLLAKATRPDFLQPETVDLDDLTRELFAKASALAQRDWRLASVGTGRIVADRQRVTQAMSGDAVELGSKLQNGLVRFWVKDTGPGVPEHEQQRIFERFVRLDRAPAGEGAGLGLAITQAVAEAHGGRVELDSRPGEGARFTVIIPTEPPQEVSPR